MTPFNIYLWQQADSFINLLRPFEFFGFLGAALLIVSLIVKVAIVTDDVDSDLLPLVSHTQKCLMAVTAIGFLAMLLSSAIPSSKTIALMVAIPAVAKSEPIQHDLPEIYQLAKEALKEQIATKK
jgi:hypothetical protein